MGSVDEASPHGSENKEQVELNNQICDEHKEGDVFAREGHGLSEEQSKINEVSEDLNNNQEGDVAVPLAHQPGLQKLMLQQQPPGPIIQWERFLAVRTLKVLLVENDDSTRQVVSALLRNCGYEVTAVANGLQAWKILEDLTNHMDLVLTEVVMPCLSGIDLLSKIVSHKTCKNIPVIMMSSNDSMGTVFKCLSKGAVDFLVKPIRKNELKNLWQHVWRRYHSSSGSGSESGIRTQKSAKSKSVDDSDNYSGSNDNDDNGSIGLNIRDGSDNCSGTQSSWTKRAVEVDSPQHMSPSDQLANPPDSTCAQVIHPKPEAFCHDWETMNANGECERQKEPTDDFMGKDLEIGVHRNPDTQHESFPTEQDSTKLTGTWMDKLPESHLKNKGALGLDSNNVSDEPSTQVADLIGTIASSNNAQPVTRFMDFSKIMKSKDITADGSMQLPSLELTLKRPRSTEGGTAPHDDRNVLKRSDLSAFSRYHTSTTSNQAPTGYGGSCCLLDNSSETVKTESTYNMISNSNAAALKQGSNVHSSNNDMGSTTKNVFSKPVAVKEKTATTSAVKCIQPTAALHPVQFQSSGTQHVMQEKVDDVTAAGSIGQLREMQCQVEVQHHHHHYHHHHVTHNMQQQQQLHPTPDHYHHHHVTHSMQQQQQQQPTPNHDLSLKNGCSYPQCGSSNMFAGPMDGNVANYSNHGSNGSSRDVNAGGMDMEIANDIVGAGGSRSGSGVDQSRFAQREAALKKFRQKRKARNFGKKVRYQSRQRLAEQRPRVRGQFVRQSVQEQRSQEAYR